MVVLDAVAMIALMKDEPAAGRVVDLLQGETAMSAVNFAEVVDHLLRVARVDRDWVDLHLAVAIDASLAVKAPDRSTAEVAADVRARFYEPHECAVSLADAFAIATALESDAPLATSDPAVVSVLRELAHPVVPLPNSRGQFPE